MSFIRGKVANDRRKINSKITINGWRIKEVGGKFYRDGVEVKRMQIKGRDDLRKVIETMAGR